MSLFRKTFEYEIDLKDKTKINSIGVLSLSKDFIILEGQTNYFIPKENILYITGVEK